MNVTYADAVKLVEQIHATSHKPDACLDTLTPAAYEVNDLVARLNTGGWFLHVTAYRDTTTYTPTGRRMRRPGRAWFNGAAWRKFGVTMSIWYYHKRAMSKREAMSHKLTAAQQAKARATELGLPLPTAIEHTLRELKA